MRIAGVGEPFVFDPYSRDVQRDPFPYYEVLRRDAPLYRDEANDLWVLSRYDDCRDVIMDWQTFSSARGIVKGQDDSGPPILSAVDPPQHTRMRKAAAPWFKPQVIWEREPEVRAVVRGVADALIGRESADLVLDFAGQVPILTIAHLCGIPRDDLATIQGWLFQVIEEGQDSEGGIAAWGNVAQYFDDLVVERRGRDGDDLISRIIHTEVDGAPLPHDEQVGLALITFIGGIEATTFHLTNTCAQLGLHPDARRALAQDPDLVTRGQEEILRYDSSVQADLRTLTRDVELHGELLPEGAQVMVLMGSANRDPAKFEHPDTLDVRRSPNPHLGFMVGIHFCLGAPLARLESTVAIQELLARVPEYSLVDAEIRRTFTNKAFMRGVESLPVELRA